MELKTSIKIPKSDHTITHESGIITLGSCFSDVIGSILQDNKFHVSVNPYGTIFNPVSIAELLHLCCNQQILNENTFVKTRNKWFNYHLHSTHFADTKEILEEKFHVISNQLLKELKTCNTLIITLGTAYCYKLKEENFTVSNCHKLPSTMFTKVVLGLEEIIEKLKHSLKEVKKVNPSIKVILTLSPVRHLKDTITLNSLSKSLLRVSCHRLVEELSFAEYFPSYEIMMDDLRDYRFYKEDMIHPSNQAEKYIWEKFSETYFNSHTIQTIKSWNSLSMALQHNPFDSKSLDYREFLERTLEKLEKLNKEINLEQEMSAIRSKLQEFPPL